MHQQRANNCAIANSQRVPFSRIVAAGGGRARGKSCVRLSRGSDQLIASRALLSLLFPFSETKQGFLLLYTLFSLSLPPQNLFSVFAPVHRSSAKKSGLRIYYYFYFAVVGVSDPNYFRWNLEVG